jgi:hypothetical protein
MESPSHSETDVSLQAIIPGTGPHEHAGAICWNVRMLTLRILTYRGVTASYTVSHTVRYFSIHDKLCR